MAALVQDIVNVTFSGTSIPGVFASANTLGNTLVVATLSAATGVSDSQGNTWLGGGGIWYALNCKAGANTVTVNYTTAQGYMTVVAMEFLASVAGTFDQSSFNSGITAAPIGGAITTTVAGGLVVGYVSSGQSPAAGTGWTLVDNTTGDGVEYEVQASAGSVAATFTQGTSAQWYFWQATFKPKSGTANLKTVTDAFTLAESFKKSSTHIKSDPFTLTDRGLLKKASKIKADAFTLAEAILKKPARSLAEAFTLVDVIAGSKTMYRAFTDALTLADVLIRSTARALAESFTLSDTLATVRARLLALTDAFTLADAVTRATARSFLEAPLALAESFLRATAKRVSDAFSVAEAFATFTVKIRVFTDAFGLTESLQRSVGKQLRDGLTLLDGAARSLARRFSESLAVLDGLAKSTQRGLSDFLGLVDFLSRGFERSLSDSFELAESWAFTLVRGLGLYPRKFLAQVLARLWAAVGTPVRTVEAVASARLFQANTEEIMIYTDPKDPESEEDFQIDWSAAANGDTITASTWEVPSDLTVLASNFTGTLTTARISGGTAGQQYPVKNLVTCASGQIRAQALLIPVAF